MFLAYVYISELTGQRQCVFLPVKSIPRPCGIPAWVDAGTHDDPRPSRTAGVHVAEGHRAPPYDPSSALRSEAEPDCPPPFPRFSLRQVRP